ncbi:MAG: dephospho-CoA kinase [bacterium]
MKPTSRPLVVGIAGIMGAGKSTVAAVFEEMGARLVDADALGREMLKDPAIRDPLVEAFGAGITEPTGEINPAKLAGAAFRSEAGARTLDGITRDALVAAIRARVEKMGASSDVVVIDAALLPEWGAKTWLDILIVVDSDESQALARLAGRSRFDEADVRRRMAHQLGRAEKAGRADIIIPNCGTLEELKSKASAVFRKLLSEDHGPLV